MLTIKKKNNCSVKVVIICQPTVFKNVVISPLRQQYPLKLLHRKQ